MKPPEVQFDDESLPPLILWESRIVVGRDESCDRILTHEKISKRHFEVFQEGARWFIKDLGSTNGTAVDGVSCEEPVELKDGARLRLGRMMATYSSPHVPESPPRATPPPPAKSPLPTNTPHSASPAVGSPEIRFDDRQLPSFFLSTDPLVLGRDGSCDITIVHEKISKAHARFTRKDDAWFLEDLGSTNGTQVNGAPCHGAVRLEPGARIVFGIKSATFVANPKKVAASSDAPEPRRIRRRSGWNSRSATQLTLGGVVVLLCGAIGIVAWRSLEEKRRDVPRVVNRTDNEGRGTTGQNPSGQNPPGQGNPALGNRDSDPRSSSSPDGGDPASSRGIGSGGKTAEELESIHPMFRGRFDRDNVRRIEADLERERRQIRARTPDSVAPPRIPTPDPRPTPGQPKPLTEREKPGSGKPRVQRVPEPVRDEWTPALAGNDAGVIARLLKKSPDASQAGEARDRLTAAPIPCLTQSGTLADGGDAVLRAGLPLHCVRADRDAVAAVTGVTVVDRTLRVRYRNDYSEGLGRKVGTTRLAPHPKQVTIELMAPSADGELKRLKRLEGKTPGSGRDTLGEGGWSDAEVWRRTLEPLLTDLREAVLAARTP